jgi:hypothetical protein
MPVFGSLATSHRYEAGRRTRRLAASVLKLPYTDEAGRLAWHFGVCPMAVAHVESHGPTAEQADDPATTTCSALRKHIVQSTRTRHHSFGSTRGAPLWRQARDLDRR